MKINTCRLIKLLYYLIIVSFPLFDSCNSNNQDNVSAINYSKDIAPLIFKHCTTCHRPGSAGTFNLLTYNDVKKRISTISFAINNRIMPPWPADTSYSHFRDEKVLTAPELKLINEWIAAGALQGDTSLSPSLPDFYNSMFGEKPDLTVKMEKPFHIPGNNKDNFIMTKIPFELPADTFVRAIEIIPGNKKAVHHVNAHIIQYGPGAKKNYHAGIEFVDTEKHSKAEAFELLDLKNDNGSYPLLTPSVTNYLPGVEVSIYPEGIGGYNLKKKGAILLDNIHYGPSPVDTSDVTSFNFFYSSAPPLRPAREFILGTSGLSPVEPFLVVHAGKIEKFITKYTLPESISLLTVNPHMHLIGKSFKAYAITPEKDTIHIISIPEWDFRWQYFYTFNNMLKIPAGSQVIAEGIYDNTENNPLIPFHPPQDISERNGSMRTTDEMFQLICTYLPYKNGDENISLRIPKK